jgi:NAD(P)-dependent dehydrogenase (short-subunit alcohol dehydrogenase family)
MKWPSFSTKNPLKSIDIDGYRKVVLMTGAGGALGRLFLKHKPNDVLLVNISRRTPLLGEGVVNIFFDIGKDLGKTVSYLGKVLGRVDVLVLGAYYNGFASIQDLKKESFLYEMLLDVYVPIEFSKQCAPIFFNNSEENAKNNKKIIFIGSGAGTGKTARKELASYSAAKAALHILAAYAHDFFFDTYKIPTKVLAPGSIRDEKTAQKTVDTFWSMVDESDSNFSIEKSY